MVSVSARDCMHEWVAPNYGATVSSRITAERQHSCVDTTVVPDYGATGGSHRITVPGLRCRITAPSCAVVRRNGFEPEYGGKTTYGDRSTAPSCAVVQRNGFEPEYGRKTTYGAVVRHRVAP